MTQTRWKKPVGGFAILFGILTIISGGKVLFGGSDAGNVVMFVLWFNFLSGPIYVLLGYGILMAKGWARWGSMVLAAAISLVFAAFVVRVMGGGAYEMRTVGAMVLRSGFWIATAYALTRNSNINRS